MVVMDSDSLSEYIKSKTIMQFLERHINDYKISDPQLTVIIYGRCGMRESTVKIFY